MDPWNIFYRNLLKKNSVEVDLHGRNLRNLSFPVQIPYSVVEKSYNPLRMLDATCWRKKRGKKSPCLFCQLQYCKARINATLF